MAAFAVRDEWPWGDKVVQAPRVVCPLLPHVGLSLPSWSVVPRHGLGPVTVGDGVVGRGR